ncbi:MAG TPA: peptidoglycan-associated lipoprotein Pal [Syntrophobacteraceae bacterium]|nr:peptidoglycan-associated lipoprotein Pal [Syntrophobacteraceae bacterium]
MRSSSLVRVFLFFALVLGVLSCSKTAVSPPQPGFGAGAGTGGPPESAGMGKAGGAGLDEARWRELGLTSEAEKKEFLAKAQRFENEDIYFDFDAYTLSEPAKRILDEKVAFLKRYPKVKVTIEGHCDERGTTEYNLALGERRANSALQYINNSGIVRTNLTTISYGKERPAATSHDEAGWAKNRRDHFVLNY